MTTDDKTPTESPRPARHWTTNLPLWGIFGAVAAVAYFAGNMVGDVRRQGAAFEQFAKDTRSELTAHHDYIIKHEAQTAPLMARYMNDLVSGNKRKGKE